MKTRSKVLGGIGVAALIAYVLACRPGFSPDGTQILFPAFDPVTSQQAVLRYDLGTRTVDALLVLPGRDAVSQVGYLSMAWTPDGKQAFVAWGEGDAPPRLRVVMLPLASRNPVRCFALPLKDDDEIMVSQLHPPCLIGGHLFFGGSRIYRLDLATGKTETSPELASEAEEEDSEGYYLIGQGRRLYYLGGSDDPAELGTVDPETLQLRRLLTFEPDSELVTVFPAIAPNGARVALTTKVDDSFRLAIYRDAKLERSILLDAALGEDFETGNAAWSPDGTTVYVLALKPSDAEDGPPRLVSLEIAVEGDAVRETVLGAVENNGDTDMMTAQLVLSPDGKTLAVSTAYSLEENRPREDRALFLADLSDPERKVTRIPVPWDSLFGSVADTEDQNAEP